MARVLAGTPSESRSRALIIAALVFAAIAAVLLFIALQNRGGGESTSTAAATTEVLVAASEIDANTRLAAEMLELRSVPVDDALAGAYASVDAAVGLPARYPIQ